MPPKDSTNRYSDDTVKNKTGKSWKDWFRIINKFDRKKKGHKETAVFLHEKHGASHWWAQMITVQYERDHGLREVGEKTDGFATSVSRTINVPVEKAFDAWAKTSALNKWFTSGAKQQFVEGGKYSNKDSDVGEFRRIVPGKRIRFTWENEEHCPGSIVEVRFTEKGQDKVSITVQHEKLPDKKGKDEMKEGWSWAMDSLKSWLETGNAIKYEDWKSG